MVTRERRGEKIMSQYLIRTRFYVELGEHDNHCLGETITELGDAVKMPEIPSSAKEHGVDKIEFITVEVFKKMQGYDTKKKETTP